MWVHPSIYLTEQKNKKDMVSKILTRQPRYENYEYTTQSFPDLVFSCVKGNDAICLPIK